MADRAASIQIEGVSKRFGDSPAVDAVSLEIGRGEFFSLLGPSGCGKTTLLRMIGGFELPSAGTIRVHGVDMTRVPAHRRPVHMVFQHYALFPHLTVADNIAFGFRYKGIPRADYGRRLADAVALVRLGGLEGRYPAQLSGGQRQRVALARALALEPELLLLDEPLAALDQKLRQEMQVELKGLQRQLGITFLFVTHDQEEALTMSDRVAVMNAGRIEQVGSPVDVFERPRTGFVAEFMGASNVFVATAENIAEGKLSLVLPHGQRLRVSAPAGFQPSGARVRFVVRPEKLALRTRDLSPRGVPSLAVTIEDRIYQGASTVWVTRGGGGERLVVHARNERPFDEQGRLGLGGQAWVCWSPRHTVLIDGDWLLEGD